jgi:hypothetical protein
MMEKRGKLRTALLIILGVILLLIAAVLLTPQACKQQGGTCKSSCGETETQAKASCGLDIFTRCCEEARNCTDSCKDDGYRVCEGKGYKECGNFDDDPCMEWSDALPCDFNQSCYRGACTASNRGSRCQYTENCSQGLECKDSGRYGESQRFCCYPFECASVLDPSGICVVDGGRDITVNGTPVLCKNASWSSG